MNILTLFRQSWRVFMSFFMCPQEVSMLLLAAFLMGDKVSALNWLGFAVCLCGISLHVGLKARQAKSRCCSTRRVQLKPSEE